MPYGSVGISPPSAEITIPAATFRPTRGVRVGIGRLPSISKVTPQAVRPGFTSVARTEARGQLAASSENWS